MTNTLAQTQSASGCCPPCPPNPDCCPQDKCCRVNYDHQCNWLRDQDCLQNSIDLLGGKFVFVNLDDKCQVDQLIREGIFLELGDVVIFAGRGNKLADQYWDICECSYEFFPDEDILYEVDCPNSFCLNTDPDLEVWYYIYEGVGIGQTRIDFCFNFGGLEVIENSFDVYVGVRPTLMAVTSPRHSCDYCTTCCH